MPRPMLLACLLMILIITSQFEWRQPLDTVINPAPRRISEREDAVKEKIILSQERSIKKLKQLVWVLREQLSECRSSNSSVSSLKEKIVELERTYIV